jgi:hypothetical protein
MKKALLISVILATAFFANAQHERRDDDRMDKDRREKIDAWKIGFITEQLQLTPAEAQVFWPVFNEYENKRHEDRDSLSAEFPDDPSAVQNMTDEQVGQLIQKHLQHEQQQVDLKKEYYQKLKVILPVKKIFRLFEAESQFKRILLERLNEHQPPERRYKKE